MQGSDNGGVRMRRINHPIGRLDAHNNERDDRLNSDNGRGTDRRRREKEDKINIPFKLKSMLGSILVFTVGLESFSPIFGCWFCSDSTSTSTSMSKSIGEAKSTEAL